MLTCGSPLTLPLIKQLAAEPDPIFAPGMRARGRRHPKRPKVQLAGFWGRGRENWLAFLGTKGSFPDLRYTPASPEEGLEGNFVPRELFLRRVKPKR